jgi:hypothetical protein
MMITDHDPTTFGTQQNNGGTGEEQSHLPDTQPLKVCSIYQSIIKKLN